MQRSFRFGQGRKLLIANTAELAVGSFLRRIVDVDGVERLENHTLEASRRRAGSAVGAVRAAGAARVLAAWATVVTVPVAVEGARVRAHV